MSSLYPLKFRSVLKDKIWGGNRLESVLNKKGSGSGKVGESWELSGVEGDLSVVSEGFLTDNNIEELIEIYMGDLVGDKVYDKFGMEFPLLIKFIDANDWLSIQVHPDDVMAKERHNSYGKTEMWYVMEAEQGAELIAGFNQELDAQKYLQYFGGGQLREVLNFERVEADDALFMPAGKVHAIGPGILLAEIQQTSDVTYRIYDWDRLDDNGESRALHTDLALDAIDYSFSKENKSVYDGLKNKPSEIVKCPYFTTNVLQISETVECDYALVDSFVIYMGIEGETEIKYADEAAPIVLAKGETVLMPAVLKHNFLTPLKGESKILEIYIV